MNSAFPFSKGSLACLQRDLQLSLIFQKTNCYSGALTNHKSQNNFTYLTQGCHKITVFYQVQCPLLYIENDAEIFPGRYTCKGAEKGFKMAFMMNKLAMINSCEIILEKKIAKNHCEIQVRTILVCTLLLIKYGIKR